MKRCFLALVLLCIPFFASGEDFSTIYGDIGDLFQNPDPNTGLTIFPILGIPSGGKYASMGTAFTAVASDAGFLEANPSASSGLKYTELSLIHNNWISDSNLEGVIYTMRFNDLGIGFGGKFLYVPFTEYNTFGEREVNTVDVRGTPVDKVSRGYYSENLFTMNISYNFFSSYYFYGLAVGSNLKFAYRHVPSVFYPETNQSTAAFMADIGILTKFNLFKFYASRDRNLSFGAVVKNLGPTYREEPLPTEATFGVAYAPIRPVTLAFDFNLPFSLYPQLFPAEQWYIASGLDVVFTDFFSLQGGFRIRGSNPRITMGSTIDLSKITFVVTYTLDLTTQFDNLDKFSVEAKFKLGDRGRGDLQARMDDLYTAGLEEYAEGNLEKSLVYLNDLIELDPRFQPATELVEIIRRALVLQREMESLQQVEE